METTSRTPKTVWMYWHQGLGNAPYLVKKCVNSWITKNPTWEVVLLDQWSLGRLLTPAVPHNIFASLSLSHQSDLVRLALLSEFGGVWADATLLCIKPLDSWIEKYSKTGFFAFNQPGKDRPLANWFLFSEPQGVIVTRLYRGLCDYWSRHNFPIPGRLRRWTAYSLYRFLRADGSLTRHWFNPLITKVLRVYPYFIMHYYFELLLTSDPLVRDLWANTEKIGAYIPHLINNFGMLSIMTDEMKNEMKKVDAPLFKLSWRYNALQYKPGTVLYSLLEDAA